MIFKLQYFSVLLFFCLSFALPAAAQTGPGGVGNPTGAGGQPRVALWLRTDMGVTPGTNLLGVSAWADQSGNGNNFAQATLLNQPIFRTNIINGRSVLRFNGLNSFIAASGAGLNAVSAVPFSFFAVTNSGAAQTNPKGLFDSAPFSGNVFRFYNDGSGPGNDNSVEIWNNNPAIGGYTLNASAPSIVSVLADFNGANRRLTAFRDASQIGTATGTNAAAIFSAPQFGRINGGDYFNADLGDAIIFNGVALNAAQRLVVENHLGAKFGRSLGANDYYFNANTVGATGFNYDVIGIMGLNTGAKQTNSTTPDGYINLSEQGTSGLTTAGTPVATFLGHNNVALAPSTNFMGIAAPYTHNLGRDYWIEINGNHTYTITFDFAAAGFACMPSLNPADYSLIQRTNQASNYTNLGITPTLSGTKVTFPLSTGNATAFINIGYRITTSTTPSPIVYSFNTNCAGGGCNWENNANWTTDPTGITYIAPCINTSTARVILNGHTVATTVNGATAPSVTINAGGRLNLGTTTGHTFTTLAGAGTLGLASATYPTVTTNTHITTAGSTIEFNGTNSFNIPVPPNAAATFRNLTITGGGTSTKTLTGNRSVAEALVIGSSTSLEVAANNLTVSGTTTIVGTLTDNSATGTTSLQNVAINSGTITGGAIGIVTIGGTLTFSGTGTIEQTTMTVTGATSIPTGATVNITSANGNKIFTGAFTLDGNWNNTANEEFFFGGDFTINNTASLNFGTACNYTFQGTGNINGTITTYTLPQMVVNGTYTNSIPQLFVIGNIDIGRGAKLINAASIVPPYFIGFNNTRPTTWRMNATSVSNNAGNSFQNLTNNGGNNIWANRNGAGTIYTVRHTDIQTNATPTTAQAIMVQFGLGTWTNGGAATGVATISLGNGGAFADNATVPATANTTASLTVNFEAGNSISLNAGATNLGNNNWQRYTWIINPTGAAITYKNPYSNQSSTVGANRMDIWREGTLAADEANLTTAGVTPTDFKFVFNGGTGVINLYDFFINPITTPIIGALSSTYCTSLTAPSSTFNVPFSLPTSASADTHFNTGNMVMVQLSNAAGSFANPTIIGTLNTTATSGIIPCAIPANTQGANFRMRIATRESTTTTAQAGFVGADNGTDIVINGYRTAPTLPQSLNIGGTGSALSVTNLAGGAPSPVPTAYQWAYRILGSPTVYDIAGATGATYTPAPPVSSSSGTYYVFCKLTSACGSSFSDAVPVIVNCAVTTNLSINGNFSATSATYPGTLPTTTPNHINMGLGFATQYGNPTTGTQAAITIDCSNGNGRETCSMFPENTFAVSFNPRNHHTNFCDLRRETGLNGVTRAGTISTTPSGTANVTGTGTNFTSVGSLVGSVLTNDYQATNYRTLTITNGSTTVTRNTGGGSIPFDFNLIGSYLVVTYSGIIEARRVTAVNSTTNLTVDAVFTGTTGTSTSGNYRFEYSNERVIAAVTSATALTVTANWTAQDAYFATNASTRNYRFIHGSRVVGGSGGYMLTANGAVGASLNLWQQNIPVTPNRDYVLTFNAINLNNASPLQFATIFDCIQVGVTIDNPAPELCSWARYSVQWNSGSKTSVSVAIRNIGAFASGNDMTIDDIQFYECSAPVGYPLGEVFVWKGITNDWFNGDNWGTCLAPTCGDDVTIPVVPFGNFYPVINANGATARDIQLNAGASLTINANRNIDVCGNFNNQGTTIFDPTSTVTFTSNRSPQQLVTGTFTGANRFANVVVNKTATTDILRFDTNIDVLRSFTITRGTVNGNSRLINVGRDFTNDVNGIFTANNSTVTFNGGNLANNGSATQIFTNNAAATACQFYNAVLDQSSTSTLFLNNDFTVTNILTLTRGKFQRSGAAGLRYVNVTNNAPTSIVGHNINSYIATIPFTTDRLILRRAIANSTLVYDFPVGDATNYQNSRLEITSPLGAAVNRMDAFFTTSNATGTLNGVCIYTPCTGGYWSISPNVAIAATGLYNMELFPVGFVCPAATTCTTEVVTIAKGTFPSTWSLAGSSYTTTYKRSGFNSFTDFVPVGGLTILPINLVRFNATAKGTTAELRWTTSMEKNNKLFHVQRSINGIHFETIGTVEGAGTSNQLNDYSFIDTKPRAGANYYRLEQMDFDGTKSYSKIEVLNFSSVELGELSVYPNPVNGNLLNVTLPTNIEQEALITITDVLGKIVYQKTIISRGQPCVINATFPTGVYVITVATADKIYHNKVEYLNK